VLRTAQSAPMYAMQVKQMFGGRSAREKTNYKNDKALTV